MKLLRFSGIIGVSSLALAVATPSIAQDTIAGVGAKTGAAVGAVSGGVKTNNGKKPVGGFVKGGAKGAATGAVIGGVKVRGPKPRVRLRKRIAGPGRSSGQGQQ